MGNPQRQVSVKAEIPTVSGSSSVSNNVVVYIN
jgi:hypothetical protein